MGLREDWRALKEKKGKDIQEGGSRREDSQCLECCGENRGGIGMIGDGRIMAMEVWEGAEVRNPWVPTGALSLLNVASKISLISLTGKTS